MSEVYEKVDCQLCGKGGDEADLVLEKYGSRLVRCRSCGLVYTNPRWRRFHLWQRYSPDYFSGEYLEEQGFHRAFDPEENLARWRAQLDRMEPFRRLGRVLDVGCATGFFLAAAQRCGWEAMGVEISPYAAQRAQEEFGIPVVVGTLPETKLSSNAFDVVTFWDTIEHLQDPVDCLREARRLLRPGGLAALSTPNLDSLTLALLRGEWRAIAPNEHIYYFTPRTLTRALVTAGFVLRGIYSAGIDIDAVQRSLPTGPAGLLVRLALPRLCPLMMKLRRGDWLFAYAVKPGARTGIQESVSISI